MTEVLVSFIPFEEADDEVIQPLPSELAELDSILTELGLDPLSQEFDAKDRDESTEIAELVWATGFDFNAAYKEHRDSVYGHLMRLTGGDHALAEDLTQDTFIKAIRSADGFIVGTNLRAWLRTIARNTFLDEVRKRQRSKTDLIAPEDMPEPAKRAPRQIDEVIIGQMDATDTLRGIRDKVKMDFLGPVALQSLGYDYEEISEILGVKLGTVRSRIHRGRDAIKTLLDTQIDNL